MPCECVEEYDRNYSSILVEYDRRNGSDHRRRRRPRISSMCCSGCCSRCSRCSSCTFPPPHALSPPPPPPPPPPQAPSCSCGYGDGGCYYHYYQMNNYNYGPSHNIQHDTYGALDYPYPYCQHHPSGPAPLPALLPAPAPAATSPGKDFSIVVIDRTANRLPAGQSHTHIRQFKTSDSGAKMIEEITANTDAYKIMVHMKSEPRAIELIAAMNGQELQDREAYRLEVVVREKTPQVRRIPYRAIS